MDFILETIKNIRPSHFIMKILAFTDVHGDKKSISGLIESAKIDNPDLLVCAGDLTNFGENLHNFLILLNKTGKLLLIIPGNHEDPDELEKICGNNKNCVYLHKKIYRIGNYLFIGSGGGGFSVKDLEFEKYFVKMKKEFSKDVKIILVTHAPVYKTKTDMLEGLGHRGCISYRKFIEEYKPILAICGHFHETSEKIDHIGKSLVINPGKRGKILEF